MHVSAVTAVLAVWCLFRLTWSLCVPTGSAVYSCPVFCSCLSPSLLLKQSRPSRSARIVFSRWRMPGIRPLYRVNSEAQWAAVTDVTPEHDAAAEATGKAYAAFNGNPAIINEARELLTHQKELSEITVRQLKQLLLNAAEGPMTNPDLVAKRVAAETKQASLMNGFEFKLNGQKITANQIDDKLEKSTDLGRAQSSLGSVERNRARVKTQSRHPARSAKRRRQRDAVSRLLFARGRRLRDDHRRDAQDA